MGGARWCETHGRSECVHHRVRCDHPAGTPVPPEGCCHQQNVRGTRSCYLHAGKALAAARAEGEATLARIYSGAPLSIDPAAALLGELGYSARAVAELRDRVALLAAEPGPDGMPGSGLFWGTVVERERDGVVEREQRAGPHAILKALNDERQHLVATAAAARATGAMETQANAARALSAVLGLLWTRSWRACSSPRTRKTSLSRSWSRRLSGRGRWTCPVAPERAAAVPGAGPSRDGRAGGSAVSVTATPFMLGGGLLGVRAGGPRRTVRGA